MSEDEGTATDDPFEGLSGEDGDGDDGDPFDELGGAGGGDAAEDPTDGPDGPETVDMPLEDGDTGGVDEDEPDPFADVEGVESEEVGLGIRETGSEGGADPADDDPFAALESDEPATDFGPSENDLFTEVDVDDVDDESVWAELAGDDAQAAPDADADVDLSAEPSTDGEPLPEESAETTPTVTETIVRKRSYCEKCEYFAEPPEVGCGYPDGEIVELIDTERFKVRNCPIVARRQSGEVADVAGADGAETDGGEEL
jgi:hypothetical protein